MSAFRFKKNKAATGKWQVVISGAGSIGFDQSMRHHKVLSDREAYAADREALRGDMSAAWKVSLPDCESDAA